MPRIQIDLPEKFTFSTCIPVRIGDINRAWHVGHVDMVAILEEARTQFMVKHGLAEEVKNAGRQTGFVLGDLSVVYIGQGYYGQTMQVEIAAIDFQSKSFVLVYRVTEAATGRELVRASTTQLVYDFSRQKVLPVSQEMKQQLSD
jgi:acyl-CoA thioester hydrolase